MLRRIGNKKRIIPNLLQLFPPGITHFIDMFMGSGAVTFAMVDQQVRHIWSNDSDNEIYNLFCVLKDHPDLFTKYVELTPYHQTVFKQWKTQEEGDPIWQAVRFIYRSNFSYMGTSGMFCVTDAHPKFILLQAIPRILTKVKHVRFLCCDFRQVLPSINFHHPDRTADSTFIYADPPYINTGNNYQHSFTIQDTRVLLDILCESGFKFGVSERGSREIQTLAQEYQLTYHEIGEQKALKGRHTEVYLCNYDIHPVQATIFDLVA